MAPISSCGAEVRAFLTDPSMWGRGQGYQDLEASCDGGPWKPVWEAADLPAQAQVVLRGGTVVDASCRPIADLGEAFVEWRARTPRVQRTVELPTHQLPTLSAWADAAAAVLSEHPDASSLEVEAPRARRRSMSPA